MKKEKLMILLLIGTIGLASCEELSVEIYEPTYTIIWQNDNGDILEIDRNIKEGTLPTYEGNTPAKEGTAQYSYVFSGWDVNIKEATENTSYTATYTKVENTFTITWLNHDGSILEIDENVVYGTIPTYNGTTPKKEDEGEDSFIFMGWSSTIEEVKSNATYTAKFIKMSPNDWIAGVQPVISEDGKTIKYGFYPQTNINDQSLINILNSMTPSETNGWCVYEGNYYTKATAKVYNNEKYTFENGTSIVDGTEYWYKCEPITWKILEENNGVYYLISTMLLDVQSFYKSYDVRTINGETINPNNYEYSDIRTWLNHEFFNKAFSINDSFIFGTSDKITLPSYEDCLNTKYGFSSNEKEASKTRTSLTTDYARANGAWLNATVNLKNNGIYWTRSASTFNYAAYAINSGGFLSSYAVDGDSHCVRPCIMVSL